MPAGITVNDGRGTPPAVDTAAAHRHLARLLAMLDHPPDGLRVTTLERWPSG